MVDNAQRIDDALSYPVITQNVDSSRRSSETPGSSQYAQMVQGALRDILGWRTRENDPNGFVAALTQSFEPAEVNGHTTWKWTQQTYAIQADLGAITGAQAAIYARAKVALEQLVRLLEGLVPLRSDADSQDAEGIRSVVLSNCTELVRQFGEPRGPLNARVDGYFTMLLGDIDEDDDDAEVPTADSQLGLLREIFGLESSQVNTLAEEQNLTNFISLVGWLNSMRVTWNSDRARFDRTGNDAFLGTQSVLLGRALAVVAESVQETYFAMDSVFLGQAEREITELELDVNGGTRVFIGELLQWVEDFANDEGPRLIKEGGKDGVIHSFRPTINKLTELVKAAAEHSHDGPTTNGPALLTAATTGGNGSSTNPTAAFHSVRVGRALDALAHHLETTAELADQIKRDPAPSISAVFQTPQADHILLSVIGKNFKPEATLHLESTDEANEETPEPDQLFFLHESELRATIDVDEGDWLVVVTNPDGQVAKWDHLTIDGPEDDDGDDGDEGTVQANATNDPPPNSSK